MVVMPKQNVPALRLEGFDGEWEESTIGSQAEIVMGQSPHGSSYNTKSAGEVLVQGNADLVDGWVTPRIWTTEPTRIAEPGTLIMSVRAPVGAMGKTRHRVVLGRGVAGIRGNEYIFQYLTKLEQDSYWSSKSSGSTFDSVNGSEIRATQISVPPTLEEQQAIGAIFTNLDAAINQHTLKHKSLQQAKTALMQRMFPQEGQTVPELRLEGFSGEWARVSVDEVATRHDNERIPVTQKDRIPGPTPYYGANGIQDYVRGFTHKGPLVLVAEDGANDLNNYPVQYVTGYAWVNNHAHVLRCKPKVADDYFLKVVLSHSDIKSLLVGGGRAKLNAAQLMQISFQKPPTLEEQQAIGALFTNLDQLIAAEAQYIASLKQAKTALLQRMFI